jgi:hypothetical protein
MILQVMIAIVTGWINRHQQQVIAYLQEENRASIMASATPFCFRATQKQLTIEITRS